LLLAVVINYIDRINLSVAAPLISKEFGWDPGVMGIVFSSFLWTYVVCLIPAGLLTDRFGSRKVYAWAISIWSAAAMLTGMITNFASMMAARLALGLGESGTYPAGAIVIRRWIPANERGLVTCIFNGGAFLGPGLGTPLVGWLVVEAGWRPSFFILGALGFLWLLFWLKFYDHPENCPWLSAAERDYILAQTRIPDEPVERKAGLSARQLVWRLISKGNTWKLIVTSGSGIYSIYLFLTWLPSYLVQAKGFELMKASVFSSVPFLVAFVFVMFTGKLSDRLLTPESIARGGRRKMVITFTLLSSIVFFTSMVDNQYLILALISLALGAVATSTSLNLTLTIDMTGDPAIGASLFSIIVLGGNVFALTAPVVTGYIVKATGKFEGAFFLAGALLIIGSISCYSLSHKPITLD
jgi:ACS family glucarate transporter-like MFS transporter